VKQTKTISGFSKLSKLGKIKWIVENFFVDPEAVMKELKSYWLDNEDQQKVLDAFSENTISNFYLPYGVAPNFVIDDKTYAIPMVIEESSVVAAASSAAKFWMSRGGFKAEIIDTKKIGQLHFYWYGDAKKLKENFSDLKERLIDSVKPITLNMENRGGGIRDIELLDFNDREPGYFQIKVSFDTRDSMGANFINTVLEQFSRSLNSWFNKNPLFTEEERNVDVIMSILSNYTPECLVRALVSCPIDQLGWFPNEMSADEFADRFQRAVKIAKIDPFRATTHNKGIFNGIDAVVLATGNDFRAVEACGHTYAARSGKYSSLTDCSISDGIFRFWIEIPLALGTVGGLTLLHPIAKRSLELLDNPNAEELMKIIAVTGLAQNFSALRSLVTTGIQKGHMKMHLLNILNHLHASPEESEKAKQYFEYELVSYTAVREFLEKERSGVS
jgi:hydroxymethylglutaryl-CoA reductase